MILNEQGKVCPCKLLICKLHGHCTECRAFHHSSEQKPLTICESIRAKKAEASILNTNDDGGKQ